MKGMISMGFRAFFFVCAVFYVVQAAAINDGPIQLPIPTIPPIPEKVNDFFTFDGEEFDKHAADEYYQALNETVQKNAQSLNGEELSKLGKQDLTQVINDTLTGVKTRKHNMSQELFARLAEDSRVKKMRQEVKSRLAEFQKQFDFNTEKNDEDLEVDYEEMANFFDNDEEEAEKTEAEKTETETEVDSGFQGVHVVNRTNVFVNTNSTGVNSENKEVAAENDDLYIIKQRPDKLYPTFIAKNSHGMSDNEIFSDLLSNNFNIYANKLKEKYQDLYDPDEDVNKKLSENAEGDLNVMDEAFLQSIISEENDHSNYTFPISKYFSTLPDEEETNSTDDRLLNAENATDFTSLEEFLSNLNKSILIEQEIDEDNDGKIDEVLLDFLSAADLEKVQDHLDINEEELEDLSDGHDDGLFKENIAKLVDEDGMDRSEVYSSSSDEETKENDKKTNDSDE